MSTQKDLGKVGLTSGFFNSEQARLDIIKLFNGTPEDSAPNGTLGIDLLNSKFYQFSTLSNSWNPVSGDISSLTTDDLTEGSTNLYFTTERARSAFSASETISITSGQLAVIIDGDPANKLTSSPSGLFVSDSGGSEVNNLVVPISGADYEVQLDDIYILLQQAEVSRTVWLPSAFGLDGKKYVILDKSSESSNWIIKITDDVSPGRLVAKADIGQYPFSTRTNIEVTLGERYEFVAKDGFWYDTFVFSGSSTPPVVLETGGNQNISFGATSITATVVATPPPSVVIVSYEWQILSSPSLTGTSTTGTTTDTITINVTSIAALRSGTYALRVAVTDSLGRIYFAVVNIAIAASTTSVNAGPDQSLGVGTTTTTLNGTQNLNPGATVSERDWSILSQPVDGAASIVTPTLLSTTINNLSAGDTVLRLHLTDSQGTVVTDNMTISVEQPGVAVNAGEDQYLDEGVTTANFYGTATPAPGISIVSITWTAVSTNSPEGIGGITFTTPNQLTTAANNVPVAARTTFRLTIVDNLSRTFTNDIDVSVATPSEMYYTKGGVDNQYDPSDPALLAWIYLPQGYDPLKPGGFGLTVFLHGLGSNMDWPTPGSHTIEDLIRPGEGLPYLLHSAAYPMSSVVVMPQLRSGMWTAEQAAKALDWAIENFAIDSTKQFITGLSSGGVGTWDIVLANPSRFAAGIPISSTYSIAANSPNPDVIKDKPFLAVAGYFDTQVPPFSDNNAMVVVEALLATSPLGKYPPLTVMPWTGDHSYRTWSDRVYNKRTAGFDFEKWFNLHTTDETKTAENYVVEAETSPNFLNWSKALILVNQLAAGSPKTSLLNRLSVVSGTLRENGERYWMINYGNSHTFNQYSVNTLSGNTGTNVPNLVETNGVASTIGIQNESDANIAIYTTGMAHYYMGMGPEMYSTGFTVDASNVAKVRITGLRSDRIYDIQIYYSNKSKVYPGDFSNPANQTGFRSKANGDWTQSFEDGWNTTRTANHYNIVPNGAGEIAIEYSSYWGGYGIVVGILLKEKTTSQASVMTERYNMALTNQAVAGWTTLWGNQATTVLNATGVNTGWVITTVATGTDYWLTFSGNYANDNEGPAGTYLPLIPTTVARSAKFSYALILDSTNENIYNLEILGTVGMGLPAGNYKLTIFASSSTDDNSDYLIKIDDNVAMRTTLISYNNYDRFLSTSGYVKEGGKIQIKVTSLRFQTLSFINAIILEKLD